MASSPRSGDEDTDEEPTVPSGVIDGIEDIEEGRTTNGDDLDEAVDL